VGAFFANFCAGRDGCFSGLYAGHAGSTAVAELPPGVEPFAGDTAREARREAGVDEPQGPPPPLFDDEAGENGHAGNTGRS
jgi:hypothetical protein